jgi:periplasmic protein CpxP/Spy
VGRLTNPRAKARFQHTSATKEGEQDEVPSMSRLSGWTVAAGLMAAVSVAVVQPSRAALTEGGAVPGSRARPIMLAQAPVGPAPNVEANIANLHQRLAIAPAQEPRFQALANVMRENARMIASMPPPSNPNAVEGLRLAIQYGQAEINDMKRMLPALQALYASLTPAQRATADQVFRQGPGQ